MTAAKKTPLNEEKQWNEALKPDCGKEKESSEKNTDTTPCTQLSDSPNSQANEHVNMQLHAKQQSGLHSIYMKDVT